MVMQPAERTKTRLFFSVTNFLLLLLLSAFLLVSGSVGFTAAESLEDNDIFEPGADAVSPLIIGGTPADVGQFPYYAMMLITNRAGSLFLCGGSLIAPDVVLTAAHCDKWRSPRRRALVGATLRFSPSNGAVWRECTRWANHTLWNTTLRILGGYDFALCKLDEPVVLEDPDLLRLNDDAFVPHPGDSVTAMGFGHTNYTEAQLATYLQHTTIPVISDEHCQSLRGLEVLDSMLCYKDEVTEPTPNATCLGDSGGPSVLISSREDGRPLHRQVGVASFGRRCGVGPSVVARISTGMPWIEDTVCNVFRSSASFCPTVSPTEPPSQQPSEQPSYQPSRQASHRPTRRKVAKKARKNNKNRRRMMRAKNQR